MSEVENPSQGMLNLLRGVNKTVTSYKFYNQILNINRQNK
jgi:hypothetical protein